MIQLHLGADMVQGIAQWSNSGSFEVPGLKRITFLLSTQIFKHRATIEEIMFLKNKKGAKLLWLFLLSLMQLNPEQLPKM